MVFPKTLLWWGRLSAGDEKACVAGASAVEASEVEGAPNEPILPSAPRMSERDIATIVHYGDKE